MDKYDQLMGEISSLAAETFATQTILIRLARGLASRPEMRPVVLQAFDDAADFAEQFSIVRGANSAHVPKSLKIIEQLRAAVTGGNQPKHGV